MTNTTRQQHWETVYETKTPEQVSWTQEVPETSLRFIRSLELAKDAKIIDIGGGDSKLVDFLLEEGFQHITVLDISAKSLERAKVRLGEKASQINWVVSDIVDFEPDTTFDLWHDRAAFHFLTEKKQIEKYVATVEKAVKGHLVLGTFSTEGPKKCSGLEITQYSKESMELRFANGFQQLESLTEVHTTPFDTKQHFLFVLFQNK